MISKQCLHGGSVRVTFTMPVGTWADSIHLVGDFNDWNPSATPLQLREDSWSVTLDLEPNRTYQYRYLINGTEWCNDWRADSYMPNELGGDNSVVTTYVATAMPETHMPIYPELVAADYSDFLLTSAVNDGTLLPDYSGKRRRISSSYAFAM